VPTPPTADRPARVEPATQEQVLTEFRHWMLALTEDRLVSLRVDFADEALKLLRAYATEKNLTLG
jgi:hypothetical protein